MRRTLPGVLVSLAFAGGLGAQVSVPVGSELRVNTHTTASQAQADVAFTDILQDFVVVWSGTGPGEAEGIWAQPFAPNLTTEGEPFHVNTYLAGNQGTPRVAGRFEDWVVVWRSPGEDGDGYGVFARRYSALSPMGSPFRVNTVTTGSQYYGVPGFIANDQFVVVWQQPRSVGSANTDIWGRLFSTSGVAIGSEIKVNDGTTGYFGRAAIGQSDSGIVIVWEGGNGLAPNQNTIRGKRFSSTGALVGAEFQIASNTSVHLNRPAIAMESQGDFVVVWDQSTGSYETSYLDVIGRRFTANGVPAGAEFRVNTTTSGRQAYARVGRGGPSDPYFIVVWQDAQADGSNAEIHARRFTNDGPWGAAFRVNSYTTGPQYTNAVAMGPLGDVIVTWTSGDSQPGTQDGDARGVYLRKICYRLAGDVNADQTINVSDVLYLINHLFAGGSAPIFSGDANGDGQVTVSDVLYLINYLFASGPQPACSYA